MIRKKPFPGLASIAKAQGCQKGLGGHVKKGYGEKREEEGGGVLCKSYSLIELKSLFMELRSIFHF